MSNGSTCHASGTGRDGFIMHVSQHQTAFNYVPKAPVMPGTRQPGMASNTVGMTSKPDYTDTPFAVSGYTGLKPVWRTGEQPTPVDAFPNLPKDGRTPAPMAEASAEPAPRNVEDLWQPDAEAPAPIPDEEALKGIREQIAAKLSRALARAKIGASAGEPVPAPRELSSIANG